MQLAKWIAAATEDVEEQHQRIATQAAEQQAAARIEGDRRVLRIWTKQQLKPLLPPVEALVCGFKTATLVTTTTMTTQDRDKLKRRIRREHRYSVRVVRMAEQFGLSIVAFHGAMLHGERYVLAH
jgi:hypothetical protein